MHTPLPLKRWSAQQTLHSLGGALPTCPAGPTKQGVQPETHPSPPHLDGLLAQLAAGGLAPPHILVVALDGQQAGAELAGEVDGAGQLSDNGGICDGGSRRKASVQR